jgi:NitT/TauT family transport system ATP-binding protein
LHRTDMALSQDRLPQSGAIVTLRAVGKTFASGTVALANLNLVVREGEFLSLVGPSGCGKSTVLRMIAGLIDPTEGEIRWTDTRPEIGFVFQEPTLMPWADIYHNVWLPLRLRGISSQQARERIGQTLALVGLTAFASAYPRELSGGMKMRVSIARALVLRPQLLLMDEPFAALDEINRFKLSNDLLQIKADLGNTVIFVTHSVYESVYLSTRIAVMAARPGRFLEDITIAAPLPRSEEFRSEPLYNECCKAASKALRRAMGSEDDR